MAAVLWFVCAPFLASSSYAVGSADAATPHGLVEVMTEKLVVTISRHRDSFDEDPQPLFDALDGLLEEAVDFRWISYNVMGPYRKQATPEQRQRFAEKFRRDLVETYGGGLVAFGNQEIVVIPADGDTAGQRMVRVMQEIHGDNGVFPLQYTMGKNRSGEWKITNVIINGINLGKTFRNQFLQRAQQYNGDLDKVVDNWVADAKG